MFSVRHGPRPALHLHVHSRKHRHITRIRTGKRLLTSPVTIPHHIDQVSLEELAVKHLKPSRGQGYKDDSNVKLLFAVAKRTRMAQDWKVALRARKTAQDEWRKSRINRAALGEWEAVRACRPQKGLGWEPRFAENVSPSDPHQLLHDHFEGIFACPTFT